MPRFDKLDDWLDWQSSLHPRTVDLGLARIHRVAAALGLLTPACPVITVAGTNGKGSSIAMLESILLAAGYRVGCFSSPHILRYNERVRLNGQVIDDAALCSAFAAIDEARGDTSLTYFEFGTLAALRCFSDQALDVLLLEVGLGGRLDAVNIIDADIALVTAIDIDHREWLGDTREAIGQEKAGIFRTGRAAICSDPAPPDSVRNQASKVSAQWFAAGEGYEWQAKPDSWSWHCASRDLSGLPLPALAGRHQLQNAAGVLMAIHCLPATLPVSDANIADGLRQVSLPGRYQSIGASVETRVDVAHNPASLAALASLLQQQPVKGKTRVVLGMLADKDLAASIRSLAPAVDAWYLASLEPPRGAPAKTLESVLSVQHPQAETRCFERVSEALDAAQAAAGRDDRVIVTGSFITVAQALESRV